VSRRRDRGRRLSAAQCGQATSIEVAMALRFKHARRDRGADV
jgi:hypothetical protein